LRKRRPAGLQSTPDPSLPALRERFARDFIWRLKDFKITCLSLVERKNSIKTDGLNDAFYLALAADLQSPT
jgi:hypothetical protein